MRIEAQPVKKPEVNKTFRFGVGMMIRCQGKWLVGVKDQKLIRDGIQSIYQTIGMPQGGVLIDEDVWCALEREMGEEIGISIKNRDLSLIAAYPKLTVYQIPAAILAGKTNPTQYGEGQVHQWFMFEWRGNEVELVMNNPGIEFSKLKLMTAKDILADTELPGFKRELYSEIFAFAERILGR